MCVKRWRVKEELVFTSVSQPDIDIRMMLRDR